MKKGYASLLVFPLTDKMPTRISKLKKPEHKIKINGLPKFVILEAIKFGLDAGYISADEVKIVLLSVRGNARKR
jgi:hypothetical protein